MKHKLLQFTFITLIISLLLFTTCFSCFAAGDWSFYLSNTDYISPSGTSIVHVTSSSPNYDQLTCSQSNLSSSLNFFFALPSNLIVGQTYILSLTFYRSQGSNAGFVMSDSPDKSANNFHTLYDSEFASMGTYNSWVNVNISFVYNGNHYLVFFIRPTSAASNGTFTLRVRELVFNRYNPNAELESQNNEIISQNDEQNSLLDEQNSLQDEQNSLIDEQNSHLFGEGETVTDDGILDFEDEMFEGFESQLQDFMDVFGDVINSERLQRGTRAFTLVFTNFFQLFLDLPVMDWVRPVIYLTLGCSIIVLILNSGLLSKGGKGKGDK